MAIPPRDVLTVRTMTFEPDPALVSLLRELAEEQRQCREYLGRLVAMEEERREGERQMETLATALLPQPAEEDPAVFVYADWFRDADGTYRVRDRFDGSSCPMTPAEIKAVTASPRRP